MMFNELILIHFAKKKKIKRFATVKELDLNSLRKMLIILLQLTGCPSCKASFENHWEDH